MLAGLTGATFEEVFAKDTSAKVKALIANGVSEERSAYVRAGTVLAVASCFDFIFSPPDYEMSDELKAEFEKDFGNAGLREAHLKRAIATWQELRESVLSYDAIVAWLRIASIPKEPEPIRVTAKSEYDDKDPFRR